jgi:hypothetical protein
MPSRIWLARDRKGNRMKVRLQINKRDALLFAEVYDVEDADSFGKACADAWTKLRQQQFAGESSVGALMDHLGSTVLDQLEGALISVERVRDK